MAATPSPDQVRTRLEAVVAAMRDAGLWDVARPDDDAFADMGPFGQGTMAFAQWLRFVLVPSVEGLVDAGGPFPGSSAVAVIAAREGDGDAAVASLVPALAAFDALFGDWDGGEDDGEPPGAPDARTRARAAYDRSRRCLDAGDRQGARAAAQAAVAADPTLRDVHNLHGWTLVLGPATAMADLEAGARAFRASRRRYPDLPEALVNLCDTLLRLGRAEEAVAEAEAAVDDPEPTGAVAHNWLGWYLSTRAPDLPRALAHLREAIRRRPGFGTAWQNLARILEGQGELGAAYHAYGEAVACGDAYDESRARERHLELQLALTLRGEAPPEGSHPPPAVDRTALALLDALAQGHPEVVGERKFGLRPSQRTPEGGVPFAVVFAQGEGRNHILALVTDLGGFRVVATQARHQGVVVVQKTQVQGDDLTRAAERAAAWLQDPRGLAPDAVTPFDAGVHALGAVSEQLTRPLGWRLQTFEATSGQHRPAYLAVSDRGAPTGLYLGVEALPGDAVSLRLMAPRLGAQAPVERAGSIGELGALTARLLDSTREALAAWDAYRARDLGAPQVSERLAARLREAGDRRWRAESTDDDYPARAGEAWLIHQGRTDRYVVKVTEDAGGCVAKVGDEVHRIGAWRDLDAALPDLAAAAATVLSRFSVDDLVVGDRVRVLEAFRDFTAGDPLTVADHRYDPHGGDSWCFEGPGGRTLWLEVMMNEDLEILGHLHRYLAPA